jgi:hypothetical protein
MRSRESDRAKSKIRANFCKKMLFAVDAGASPATLLTPPEAGLPGRKTRELVLAYFGTANWNSILSRHDERSARRESGGGQTKRESSPEKKLGFFCGSKEAQAAGSLISTYRVVNTTLRAESEN